MRMLIAAALSFAVVAPPVGAQLYLGHPETAIERIEFADISSDFGFGRAVVRYDDQLIVGAVGLMGSYSVTAYRRAGGEWVEFQRFENVGGIALARVGDLLAIGAHRDEVDGLTNAGAVKMYAFDAVADAWQLQDTLTSPTPAEAAYFGQTLAVADETLYVGEPYLGVWPLFDGPGDAGALGGRVHAFRDTGGWSVVQTLAGDADVGGAAFGMSLAAAGDHLVVGAIGEGTPSAPGVVYRYGVNAGTATRIGAIENPSSNSQEGPFGHAVAVHGNRLLVGGTAFAYDDMTGHGAAHLFDLAATEAEHLATFTGDGRFGWSVLLLDEKQALVGAPNASVVHHFVDVDGEWVAAQRIAEPPQTTFRDGAFGETLLLTGGELFIGAPSAVHDFGASDGAVPPSPSFSQGGKLYEVPLVAPPLADLSASVAPVLYTTEEPVDVTFLLEGDTSEGVSAAYLDLRTHLTIREIPAGCIEVYATTLRCELGAIDAGEATEFTVTFEAPPESFADTAIDAYVGSELPDPDSTDNLAPTHIFVLPNPSVPAPEEGGGALGWLTALFLLAMLKSRIRLRRSAPCSARTCGLPASTPNSH